MSELERLLSGENPDKAETVAKASSGAGGTAEGINSATGASVSVPVSVQVAPVDLSGVPPEHIGSVSVNVEMSRNQNYNKVAVSVYARTPCKVGTEAQRSSSLLEQLSSVAEDYADKVMERLLSSWSRG